MKIRISAGMRNMKFQNVKMWDYIRNVLKKKGNNSMKNDNHQS